jgi:hypothetical protein
MIFALQFFIGWVYGHVFEYIAHRYLLHDRKKFKKIFRHHFGQHHNVSRKNNMYDENYLKILNKNNLFEPASLFLLLLLHIPTAFIAPGFFCAIVWSLASYFFLHRKSHIDVEWGKKWLPWHYEHHMGKNQHANWGVRLPIIDNIAVYVVNKKKSG